jgi:hypothetical protein
MYYKKEFSQARVDKDGNGHIITLIKDEGVTIGQSTQSVSNLDIDEWEV